MLVVCRCKVDSKCEKYGRIRVDLGSGEVAGTGRG